MVAKRGSRNEPTSLRSGLSCLIPPSSRSFSPQILSPVFQHTVVPSLVQSTDATARPTTGHHCCTWTSGCYPIPVIDPEASHWDAEGVAPRKGVIPVFTHRCTFQIFSYSNGICKFLWQLMFVNTTVLYSALARTFSHIKCFSPACESSSTVRSSAFC